MADIYQFASEQWQMIPDVRDEIMDGLEEEGKGEAFEEVEALLGEQLAAAQRASEREAWGQNVLALIQAMPVVREALGLPRGGDFGYNRRTKEHGKRLADSQKEQQKDEAGINGPIYRPESDKKPSRFQQLLDRLRGHS